MPGDPMPGGTTLAHVAEALGDAVVEAHGDLDVIVRDVHHDSRRVTRDGLFVAVPGSTVDGHDFAASAVERGASAVIVERHLDLGVPALVVEDARRCLGPAAAAVHDHPDRSLDLIGVTGTNGKTSVTYLMEAIAAAAGRPFGLVGTIGARVRGRAVPLSRTTPEASDLIRLLATMVDEGVDLAALEVSSHAMELGRVDGISFDVAAFTNLSQDHLDFHGDMESYYRAKRSLFTAGRVGEAVVWTDDPAGRRLVSDIDIDIEVTTVGTGPDVDVQVVPLHSDLDGVTFEVTSDGRSYELSVPQPGAFTIANAAVAGVCATRTGIDMAAVAHGLSTAAPPPGRMERIAARGYSVFVDYAHTPDAIERVIEMTRVAGAKRVIAVAGAGGDRDQGKRPLMGRALARADVAVVTSDNPRSEDPDAVIAAVMSGIPGEARVEPDRRTAIAAALAEAEAGDVVLVLGKGHEQGQEVAGGVVIPFDDRHVVREELSVLGDRENMT